MVKAPAGAWTCPGGGRSERLPRKEQSLRPLTNWPHIHSSTPPWTRAQEGGLSFYSVFLCGPAQVGTSPKLRKRLSNGTGRAESGPGWVGPQAGRRSHGFLE